MSNVYLLVDNLHYQLYSSLEVHNIFNLDILTNN